MKHITTAHMTAVVDELRKEAFSPIPWARAAVHSNLSGRYGRQLALGTGAGAVAGAAYDDENRVRGALKGGLTGLALTGAGQLATKGGREAAGKMLKNTGERWKYQATGKGNLDPARAREIGVLPTASSNAARTAAEEESLAKGWQHLPGVAKGIVKQPGALISNAWRRSDLLNKGFTGLAAYDAGRELTTPTTEGGPGKAERVLRSGVGSVGFLVSPGGILPGMALGTGAGHAGGFVGRHLDKMLPHKPAPAEMPVGQVQPMEQVGV